MSTATDRQTVHDAGWMSLKRTESGYVYAERKGRDSIAVLLRRTRPIHGAWADSVTEYLVRDQPLPAIDSDEALYACPITGSLEPGEFILGCVEREVLEETGYRVVGRVRSWGHYIASTQMSETVFMFTADVTGIDPEPVRGDGSYHESVSRNRWATAAQIFEGTGPLYVGLLAFAAKGLIK